jgi:cytochrome c551/c552
MIVFTAVAMTAFAAQNEAGFKLFKRYCWGCHHQTAEAFGPSFQKIAHLRNKPTIMAMMTDPEATSKVLGYKRNSMPSFSDLTPAQKEALADYILSFKDTQ